MLVYLLSQSDYKSHILFQLGGWPNTEGGSLVLAHVPYVFKASILKEAQNALSIIIYQMGISKDMIDISRLAHNKS